MLCATQTSRALAELGFECPCQCICPLLLCCNTPLRVPAVHQPYVSTNSVQFVHQSKAALVSKQQCKLQFKNSTISQPNGVRCCCPVHLAGMSSYIAPVVLILLWPSYEMLSATNKTQLMSSGQSPCIQLNSAKDGLLGGEETANISNKTA